MVKPKRGTQLSLLPFRKVVRAEDEFDINLYILKGYQQDGSFKLEVVNGSSEYEKWIQYGLRIGASIETYTLAKSVYEELLTEDIVCKECGAPAIYYLDCSCGIYTWCKEHKNSEVFWDHIDHNCFPECCRCGHRLEPETKSIKELEAMVPMMKVSMKEENPIKGKIIFTVQVHYCSEEERLRELEWLMLNYDVEELDGELWEWDGYDVGTGIPLTEGSQAVVIPTIDSSPLLALSVIRYEKTHGEPLIVQIIEKKNHWDYLCLLPKGVTIPGHSRVFQDNLHCIELNCMELLDPEEFKEILAQES